MRKLLHNSCIAFAWWRGRRESPGGNRKRRSKGHNMSHFRLKLRPEKINMIDNYEIFYDSFIILGTQFHVLPMPVFLAWFFMNQFFTKKVSVF